MSSLAAVEFKRSSFVSFLGKDTKRAVIFVVVLCTGGLLQFFANGWTRHIVVVGGLQGKSAGEVFGDGSMSSLLLISRTTAKSEDSYEASLAAGVVEYDYVDYHLRAIMYFLVILFVQPIAARVATDEGNGRHRAVGQRLSAACTSALAISGTLVLGAVASNIVWRSGIVQSYVAGSSMATSALGSSNIIGGTGANSNHQNEFTTLKFCGSSDPRSAMLCIWHHCALRLFAFPFHAMANCGAIPCLLGVHRVDLVMLVVFTQSFTRVFFSWLAVMQLQMRLTGAGCADLISAALTTWLLWYLFRQNSVRSKYYVNWSLQSACRCTGGGQAGVEHIPLLADLRTLLPRAIVFALMRILTTRLFDIENPASVWTLNTAFGAMQQLQELPTVVGDSLALVTTIVGCKYLNHIYMIYNPSDFGELTKRFPWIIMGITFGTALLSVFMAPFMLGSKLASATGVGFVPGAFMFIVSQVTRGASLAFEALLFANVEFYIVARISLISFLPFVGAMLVTWALIPWTPMIWLSIFLSAAVRLYLASQHVYNVTMKSVTEDVTTIDEFDALLDDTDDEDDGPEDLEARGLLAADNRKGNTRRPSRPRRSRRHSRVPAAKKYASYEDFEKADTEYQEAFREKRDAFSSDTESDRE